MKMASRQLAEQVESEPVSNSDLITFPRPGNETGPGKKNV
jgi:hypothetical protein